MEDEERAVGLEPFGFRYAFPAIEKIVFGEPASKAIASEVETRGEAAYSDSDFIFATAE